MKLLYRKLSFLFIILFLSIFSIYYSACSSTEETTARLAYATGDYKKAESEAFKETQQNPQNEEAWGYLAMSRLQLKKIDESKDAYSQYLKFGKSSLQGEFNQLYYDLLDKGFNEYKHGSVHKDSSMSQKDSLEIKKHFQNAIGFYKGANVIYPDSTEVMTNMGIILEKLGSDDEALEYYQKVLKVNKNDTLASERYASILINKVPEFLKNKKFEDCINQLKPVLNSVIPKTNVLMDYISFYTGATYYAWADELKKTTAENSADSTLYIDKFKASLSYIEPMVNVSNKDLKIQVYTFLVSLYGNLHMYDKAKEALEIEKKLEGEK